MAANIWTPEKIATAERMHAEGRSYREIGREVGHGHRVVCSMLWRRRHALISGEGHRPWTADDIALLLQLDSQGVSRHDIAERLRRTLIAVERKIAAAQPKGHVRPPRAAKPKRARVAEGYVAPYSAPAQRRNDDAKHLTLIGQANNGCGFPFYLMPATHRVAA